MAIDSSPASGDETPDVFISYSHDDHDAAQCFALALEREGLRVWWDPALRAGDRWDDLVERALRSARAVVVLWSKQSVASHWVRSEAALAHRNGRIAPAMIEMCERPVMFELVQTANLSHWRGEPADFTWLSFLADVRRLVEIADTSAAARSSTAATASHSQTGSHTQPRLHLSSGKPLPNNLPKQLSATIGRDQEIADIAKLLIECNLAVLVGPGGVGKTRLALEVGQRIAANGAGEPVTDYLRRKLVGGVWMIDLAALTDPSFIAATVAATLNISPSDGISADKSLFTRLAHESLLLVLDNCEHLIDAAAMFCERFMDKCGGVKILATSHEPLRIQGEMAFHVQPLSLPAGEITTAERALSSPAVALFVARARSADSRFALQDSDAPTVATICRRLDGLPLAIEMAAARVSTLGLETLAAHLDQRFRILTAGRRTALPRQQTLRATLEWSYGLLNADQQAMFCQLGIFPAAFSLEAACAVSSVAINDSWSQTEIINHLAARSLLTSDASRQPVQYRMLESTREFARLRLSGTAEWGIVERRHAAYTRERMDNAYRQSFATSDADLCSRYGVDLENLRVAIDWSFKKDGDVEIGFALLGASEPLYLALAQIAECRSRIECAIERINEVKSDSNRARVWDSFGRAIGFSDPSKAFDCLSRAVPVYRETDALVFGALLVYMGRIAQVIAGRAAESERLLDEAAPLVEATRLPRLLGHLYRGMANRAATHGDFGPSVTMMQRASRAFLEGGALGAASTARASLGYMLWAFGDVEKAIETCKQVLSDIRAFQFPNESAMGFALGNLAGMLTELDRINEAGTTLTEAIPLLVEPWQIWVIFDHIARLAARCRESELAAQALGFADYSYAEHKASRQPNEARAYEETKAEIERTMETIHAKSSRDFGSQLPATGAVTLAAQIAALASERRVRDGSPDNLSD